MVWHGVFFFFFDLFFFFEILMLIKSGPAVKNKFHKLVEEIIIWEKMAAEISRVFVKQGIYCNI